MKRRLSIFLSVLIIPLVAGCSSPKIFGIQFAPSEKAPEPIIALYDNSGKYIHLAIYSLTKDEFAEALIRAHKRGVEVKVLIDRIQASSQSSKMIKLEGTGIELRRSKGGGLMHNKFAIIDGIIIYTGSYNHTEGATTKNDENYIIIKDKEIAHIYETQFHKIWEKHKQ